MSDIKYEKVFVCNTLRNSVDRTYGPERSAYGELVNRQWSTGLLAPIYRVAICHFNYEQVLTWLNMGLCIRLTHYVSEIWGCAYCIKSAYWNSMWSSRRSHA